MATRLKTLTVSGLLGKIQQDTVVIGKLLNWVHLTDLRDKVVAQDRKGVAIWIEMLPAGGYITPEQAAMMLAVLQETEEVPDPVPKVMPKQYRAADGTPGTWRVEARGNMFVVIWDEQLSGLGTFKSYDEARAAQKQWFDDHPPVEIK